jgi:transcriptional regulator with XRE-family HTH domain
MQGNYYNTSIAKFHPQGYTWRGEGGHNMTLGEKIHLLRRRLRWTQRELGQAAEINTNTVARLERDEIPDPGSRLMLRLARALGTSVDYLLGRTDDEPSDLWPTGIATAWWRAIPADQVHQGMAPL